MNFVIKICEFLENLENLKRNLEKLEILEKILQKKVKNAFRVDFTKRPLTRERERERVTPLKFVLDFVSFILSPLKF